MPAFWSSKPKAPPINTNTSAPQSTHPHNDDPNARAFSATPQGTRSSEEDGIRSGQVTPRPSGLDHRIPAIPSVRSALFGNSGTDDEKMLHSPTPTPRQTTSAGTETPVDIPPPPPTPSGAPVGPPRGKLTVRILQARNLKVARADV